MNNPILYLYCEKTKELIEYNKVFSNEYERITHNTILENFIQRHMDDNDVVFLTKNDDGDFINTGITIRDYFISQNHVFTYEEMMLKVPHYNENIGMFKYNCGSTHKVFDDATILRV